MKTTRTFILPLVMVLPLAGCGDPTLEDLKGDPDLLKETLAECRQMSISERKESELCALARRAVLENTGEKIRGAFQGFADGIHEATGK